VYGKGSSGNPSVLAPRGASEKATNEVAKRSPTQRSNSLLAQSVPPDVADPWSALRRAPGFSIAIAQTAAQKLL
jgi:hypothetical protein